MRGRAVFTSFYEQLKGVRAFHRKYPNTLVEHEPNLDDALNPQVPVRPNCCFSWRCLFSSNSASLAAQFSGEERFGKYVDLHEFYARFLNLPALKWCVSQRPRGSCFSHDRRTDGRTDRLVHVVIGKSSSTASRVRAGRARPSATDRPTRKSKRTQRRTSTTLRTWRASRTSQRSQCTKRPSRRRLRSTSRT